MIIRSSESWYLITRNIDHFDTRIGNRNAIPEFLKSKLRYSYTLQYYKIHYYFFELFMQNHYDGFFKVSLATSPFYYIFF